MYVVSDASRMGDVSRTVHILKEDPQNYRYIIIIIIIIIITTTTTTVIPYHSFYYEQEEIFLVTIIKCNR